jgi:hypothetical protein
VVDTFAGVVAAVSVLFGAPSLAAASKDATAAASRWALDCFLVARSHSALVLARFLDAIATKTWKEPHSWSLTLLACGAMHDMAE